MFRSYLILTSLLGLALAGSAGCLPGPMAPSGDGGTGGTGTGGTGTGGTGTGGTVPPAECPEGAADPDPVLGQVVETACRNSFNQAVSVFPITMDVDLDCAVDGAGFNATITPALDLDKGFLQIAAETLCELGTPLTEATVNSAQVRVDAVAGAECNDGGLSVLSSVPQTVTIDVTFDPSNCCGSDPCLVTVNEPVRLDLPEVSFPCTAGQAPGPVAICATGETPLNVVNVDTPVDTYVEVAVGGTPAQPAFSVDFACGGPATTEPLPPGDQESCDLKNEQGGDCDTRVGTGDFGEQPFPTSDCDLSQGIADATCETVPIALDPLTDSNCATFPIEASAAACQQYFDDGFVCDDGDDCTADACEPAGAVDGSCGSADNGPCCTTTNEPAGTECMTDTGAGGAGGAGGIDDGVCDEAGTCIEVECRTATQDIDCDDGLECTDNVCDATTAAGVCTNPDNDTNTCDTCASGPCKCSAGVCVFQNCNDESDPGAFCDDGNECTTRACEVDGSCSTTQNEGQDCLGGTGSCDDSGNCIDKCVGFDCSDGEDCTDDICTSATGTAVCSNPNNDANTCTNCPGAPGPCQCRTGSCVDGLLCPPAPVNAIGIPMACRNSFNQAVSTFPIDLTNVTPDDCIFPGQPFNTAIDPIIALDTAFLEAAAQTLCDLGTFLTSADVTFAQVSIDAIAGATCTEQLAVLPGTPVTVDIASTLTCVGGTNEGDPCTAMGTECQGGGTCNVCGNDGITAVTEGITIPLPPVTLPCTMAGTAGSEVQICSTGTVPLAISLTVPAPPPTYTETYVGVSVGDGAITVAFACNTSSTTNPPPGQENDIGCVLTNQSGPSTPNGLTCGQEVGSGDVGQTPLPTSDCNTADGPPIPNQTCDIFGNPTPCSGTCETVPVGVDPSNVCALFNVERCRDDTDCDGQTCNTATGACG